MDIQETVKEVLATETEYDGVHIQPSPDKLLLLMLIIEVCLKPISKK